MKINRGLAGLAIVGALALPQISKSGICVGCRPYEVYLTKSLGDGITMHESMMEKSYWIWVEKGNSIDSVKTILEKHVPVDPLKFYGRNNLRKSDLTFPRNTLFVYYHLRQVWGKSKK